MSTSMTDLILPTHQAVHHELEPYTELMQLLRALDNKAFVQLTKVYTDTMSKLYKRDLKRFFEEAKNKLICKRLQGIYVIFFSPLLIIINFHFLQECTFLSKYIKV